ncbi:C40 family peptidase [Curtobacterium ammoniigenes]|uniref:C40 family peptidase n=1 Tax=Curtobacterium ammoniigenes TaxID=395387 RepID=UPI000830BE28|nr:C40 family peptidase [Curtobacterium ammoniigenes]
MSFIDAVSRMQQIESQIVELSDPFSPSQTAASTAAAGSASRTPAVTAATGTSGATSSGTAFAAALGAATGTPTTAVAGQLVNNGVTGADVVADAQKYIGVPYVFGGTTSAGLDCSGLVQRVYKDLGISVPRLVGGQGSVGEVVPSLADAQPGDLIVCNGGGHIVIYAGNGKIIQAPKPGGSVEEMNNWISPSNVVTIRRIVPSSAAQPAAAVPPTTVSPGVGAASTAALLDPLLGSSAAGSGVGSSGLAELAALLAAGGGSGLTSLLGAGGGAGLTSLLGSTGSGTATTSSLAGLLTGLA